MELLSRYILLRISMKTQMYNLDVAYKEFTNGEKILNFQDVFSYQDANTVFYYTQYGNLKMFLHTNFTNKGIIFNAKG